MPVDDPPRGSAPSILHLAPHPDDELIGPPATLMALRDAGWRVVNQACGLGSDPSRRAARAAEVREACRRAGFELRLPGSITRAIAEVRPAIVVSPGPDDRHPAHERVAAAARAALEAWRGVTVDAAPGATPRWWTYGIWGPLAEPTLATAFDEERLAEVNYALSAHAGELDRADYRRLVHGRAEVAAVIAPQLLFGFGDAAAPAPPGGGAPEYAELLREQLFIDGIWRSGESRWLDPAEPLAP